MASAGKINDRIFMAFPAGWFAGIVLGAIYAGFHWNDLQIELGRILLIAVTSSQVTTLLLMTLIVRSLASEERAKG